MNDVFCASLFDDLDSAGPISGVNGSLDSGVSAVFAAKRIQANRPVAI